MATADEMARQLTATPRTSGRTATAIPAAAPSSPDDGETIRRLASPPSSAPSTAPSHPADPERPVPPALAAGVPLGSAAASEWFRRELERNIDTIVDRLEDRIRIDLERRGGRTWREI